MIGTKDSYINHIEKQCFTKKCAHICSEWMPKIGARLVDFWKNCTIGQCGWLKL
jgi:hypothetical protein